MVYKVLCSIAVLWSAAGAQTVEIALPEGDAAALYAVIEQEITLSIRADLAGVGGVSGLVFHLAVPAGSFAYEAPTPFRQGALFAGATEFSNDALRGEKAIGGPPGMDVLSYALVTGPAGQRGRTGRGEVARLVLRPLRTGAVPIAFVQSPAYPGNVVLDDGIGERSFQHMRGIELFVGASGKPAIGDTWAALKLQFQ